MNRKLYNKIYSVFLVFLLTISLVTMPLSSIGHAEELTENEPTTDSNEIENGTDKINEESSSEDTESNNESEDDEKEQDDSNSSSDDNEKATDELTAGDSTPPEIESVEVSPKEADVGDAIKIKAKITDDISGVKSAMVSYDSPSGNRGHEILLEENEETGYWEGYFDVKENDESGEWIFKSILVRDNADNRKVYSVNDIETNLNFIISNSEGDSTPPVIESVEISSKEVNVGDTIKIKAKITDDISGVKSAMVSYDSPSGNRDHKIFLEENEETGYWEGYFDVKENDESGEWIFKSILVHDNADNRKVYSVNDIETDLNFIINKSTDDESDEDLEDDSNKELPYQVINANETWFNTVIDKDVFIGPDAVVSILGNTVVNGDIYIYGALKSYGGLTLNGTLHAQQVNFGTGGTLYQGSAHLGGSNSITSMKVSGEAYNIPLEVDYEILEENDELILKGETLPFLNVYIDDENIDVSKEGAFSKQLSTYNNTVTIIVRDIFGKNVTKQLDLGLEEVTQEEETEEIPYETIKEEDPDLEKGKEVIDQKGENGEKVIIYEITFFKGEEINREVVREEVTIEPTDEIIRVGTKVTEVKEEQEKKEIPYETIKEEDPDLEKGEEVIDQEGVTGERLFIYEVTYVNGEETNRKVISEEIVSEPVDEIIRVGTKQTALKNGDRHKDVVQLKKDLAKVGFVVPGKGTKLFGNETEKQVKAFQKYYGLETNGTFDQDTDKKLNEVVNSPLQNGKRHEDTVQLKKDLAEVGFAVPGNSTTLFGKQTENQVKAFQKRYGLVQNGIADEVTLEKLNEVVNQDISNGVRHHKVVQLKKDLAKVGFAVPGNGTTLFGKQTEKQVKAFQKYYGLDANGTLDKSTEKKLSEVVNSPLQNGKRHEDTVQLKQDLAEVGFTVPGNGTTLFGKQTEKQVKAFQKQYGLVQNGIADEVTLEKLNEVVNQDISNGMRHHKVIQLKKDLAKVGFTVPGNGTTLFGKQTEKQVKAFQKYYGLDTNGTFDKSTEKKLSEVVNSPLQNGKRHEDTVQLKQDLAEVGFTVPGNGTTLFGKQTEKQVKAFQKQYGLVQNGIADEVTLEKLNEVVNQDISNGMRHHKVIQLKKDLAKVGFTVPGNGTTLFGKQTEKQVKAFQKYYGLETNGIFDKATDKKLTEVVNSPLQNGKRHEDVVQLKKDLAEVGFAVPGNGTTYFGNQTEKQVKAFQKQNNLVQNGIADEKVLTILKEIISSK